MNFWLENFGKQIILSNGKTLSSEYEKLNKRLDLNTINSIDTTDSENRITKKQLLDLRKELFGSVTTEFIPWEYSLESLKQSLGYTPLEWKQLSFEEQGKALATKIISNQLETLERYYSALERNQNNG